MRERQPAVFASYLYNWLFTSHRKFIFNGKELSYFVHPYNFTWASERCIEIPIAVGYLRDAESSVLEVGNVLSHYFVVKHRVIDKYEKAPGVQNVDAEDYSTDTRYGLVLSISTLEHVGMDTEGEVVELKIRRVVENLTALLAPSGLLVATVPLGFNRAIDRIIDEGSLFSKRLFMKRTSYATWVQADYDDVRGAKYGEPFKYANAICVLTVERKT